MGPALFREVAALYEMRRRIHTESVRTLRSQVRILARAFGHLEIGAVDVAAIETWMAHRLDAGISKATLNRQRACLHAIYAWAGREGLYAAGNPVDAVQRFREGVGRTRYLTPAEADRLVLAAASHLKTVLVLGLHTGGRLGELLALTWADVDLDAGVITFRRETTKGRKTRHVPIGAELEAWLRKVRRGRADQTVAHWNGLRLRSVRTAFEHARAKAGLGRDVVVHTLRHTFASWWMMNGGEPLLLQRLLGHTDAKLTARYVHLSPGHVQAAARFIGAPGRRVMPGTADAMVIGTTKKPEDGT